MNHETEKPSRTRTLATLIASTSFAALLVSAAFATGTDRAPNERAKTWLGELPAATIVPAAPTGGWAAPIRRDADARERLEWWSVGGAAYRWNEIMLDEMQEAFVVLPMAARHLALFHAALDDAVVHARQHPMTAQRKSGSGAAVRSETVSEHAAVAETAAAIIAHLFPARAAHAAKLAEEAIMLRAVAGADTQDAILAGRTLGQLVAAAAIDRARTDGSDAKWTGSVPDGAGVWKGANPIAPLAGTWRPWVLSSPGEFRPMAPPRIDSDQARAALVELKTYSRTPKSNHRAIYWEVNGGARAHTLWNEIARTKLLESGKGVELGARVLAALNVAIADAGVACWDAKYAFWYIRPPQADPELKSLFNPPNHPSYPAAHGCFSTAAATVLASFFPRDRERLLSLGKEAAEARVWAGIHYRFDIEAGQEIGRKVAEKVLARAVQ